MTFARGFLRYTGGLLLIMAIVFMLGAAGLAEEGDPVTFTIQASPASLTAPGPVSISIRVSNSGSADMIAPVTLYDPEGSVVPSFGDGGSYLLKSGDSRSWEGTWNVTQAQLDAGFVSYSLKYHLEDDSGALVEVNRKAQAAVAFSGERVNLVVTRTISPQVVRSGGTANVTYELYNSGNVELKDIRVQEKISKNAKTVSSLPAGERTTVSFSSRIGNADLVSNAAITYKAANSTQTLKETVEDAAIPLAKPNLKIELSTLNVDGVNVGEAATLVITFTNAGNISYSNVTVTEAKRGEIITNLSIPAGATVVEQKEFILMEPATFKVTATLPDNTGETQTITTKELTVGVFDPEKQLLLTLNLTCDQETVPNTPADVKMHLTVTNNSNIKAEKIAITHGSTSIYTINSLEPGQSLTLDRDFRISQAGQFRFTASLKDSLNNTVTFESNTIRVDVARAVATATPVPVATVAPPAQVTPLPADPLLNQGRSVLWYAGIGLAGLFGVALVLFIVSTVVRIHKRSKSNAAYDHLDLAERRDYTEPAAHGDEPVEETAVEREEDEAESAKPTVELPHEKVLNSVEKEVREAAPAVQDLPDTDGEGGYRVSRLAQEAAARETEASDAAPERTEEPQQNASAEEQPEAPHRRRRRASRTEDGE